MRFAYLDSVQLVCVLRPVIFASGKKKAKRFQMVPGHLA